MKIGEVCLLTNNVVRLANFYKALFSINNSSNDSTHQFIIAEETTLTIYNDALREVLTIITSTWLLMLMM